MNYIYENLVSPEQVEALHRDPVFPMVRELHFKYGLKVIEYGQADNRNYNRAVMSRDDGLAICAVRHEGEEFCYYSPYYRKERGSSTEDRHTLRSKKMSTLMGVIKKKNVVPTDETVRENAFEYNIKNGIDRIKSSIRGVTGKNLYELTPNDVHALLKRVFGQATSEIDLEKCKLVLDKYDEADRLRTEREKEVYGFFLNEFYVVGANKSNHLVIGSVKCVGDINEMEVQIVKPLKRIASVDECEYQDLQAALLMTKVVYENGNTRMFGNTVPYEDKYDENLGMVFSYRRVGRYDHAWAFIPCQEITSASSPQSSANTTLTCTE